MGRIDGSVLTPDGWIAGSIRFGEQITAIEGSPVAEPTPPFVLPGFVDLHVHGGGGADMMAGTDAIRTATRLHARHGTTSLLVTTVTAPMDETVAVTEAAAEVMAAPGPGEARVLGLHLEGPFINPGRLGAQPAFTQAADPALFARLAAAAPVRVVTIAPECDAEGRLLAAVRAAGAKPQIGHSLCDHARACACLAAGWGITHLFNAMAPFAHRGSGLVGAALAHAAYAEIIPDLVHVDAGAILAARRAIPNLYGVTDATAGAGEPDGEYRMGAHTLFKAHGAMRLADGTLAGSALTMDRALSNLVGLGLPLAEASRRLSTIPADWLGEKDVGRLAVGARAHLVVLDDDLRLAAVHLGSQEVELADQSA